MLPTRSGKAQGPAQIADRQIFLSDARDRALRETPTADGFGIRYRFTTISRNRGSLGDAVARELADDLGWKVFDKEIVDQVAQFSHVRQHIVEQVDERSDNLVRETVQRILTMAEGASFGPEEYHGALLKTLACMAARGNAILVGRGANFALRKEAGGLHVRVVASPDVRIRRLMERWQVPAKEAHRRMERMDLERRNFVRHHFKQDIDDLNQYDVVFSTDSLTARQVADAIIGILGVPAADRRRGG